MILTLQAATEAALQSPTPAVGPLQGPDLNGYLFVCVGLIAAIALLAYGFRRLFGNAVRDRNAKRALAVLDVLPLGGRRRVAVVRCYDRTFALGLGDKEIHMLAELDLDDAQHEIARNFPAQAETFAGELEVAEPRSPRSRVNADPAPAQVARAGSRASDDEVLGRLRREGVLG